MRNKTFIIIIKISILISLISSCTSAWSKKYKDDAGVMYGMIYDGNEEGVSGVSVKINGKEKAVSDGQGRFIIKFLFADIRVKKEQRIELEKEGYEKVEDVFYYEPMSLLHIKLESGEDIVKTFEIAMEEKEYDKAEKLAERLLKIRKYEDEGFFLIAVIRYVEGKKDQAREILEKINRKEESGIKEFIARLKKENGKD